MWRAELTHDNDRHCEFRPGIRPTLMDETRDICRPPTAMAGLAQDEPAHHGRGGRRHVALHSRPRVGGKNRPFIRLHSLRHFGAGEGIRTLDPNLGKVVLYP
jgi:hypothetical protein